MKEKKRSRRFFRFHMQMMEGAFRGCSPLASQKSALSVPSSDGQEANETARSSGDYSAFGNITFSGQMSPEP
jgi:hypothetical protein